MTTLHRIPSVDDRSFTFRCMLASCFFALSIAFFAARPPAARAQQHNNPTLNPDCGGPSITSTPTNAGTDFLLCFEENVDTTTPLDDADGYLEIYIATLGDTATVTITSNQYPSLNKVYFMQPNSSVTYRITDSIVNEGLGVNVTMHDLWITSDEVADNRVVQVQSTSFIVCYGMDFKAETADAFCALSAQSAGTDYGIMSYPNSQSASPKTSSQFAVAAFQDNTTVTITPSARTLGSNAAGVPFKVTLQQGQCVQVQTNANDSGLDLTGSTVSANHPITVYSGHERTEVPLDSTNGNGGISRDMLLEVMPPTSTWGYNFVLNAIALDNEDSIGPQGDLMRVLALDSNTVVTVNGKSWVTLGSKLHPSLFSDSLIKGPTLVSSTSSSKPLLVGEIEHSDYYVGGGGDPSLSIVPPVDQTYNNYTFFSSPDMKFDYNSVIIATDTSSQGTITIDGTLLPPFFFKPVPGNVGGRSFSIYEDQLQTSGVHTISSTMPPGQGFTILAYGLGDVISYGYTAGSLLVPQRAIRIEYPPQSIEHSHTNSLNFHNTAYQPAYLDSAIFIPNNPDASAFGIHVAENVGLDIGRVDIGGSGQIHLVSDNPLTDPISGTVKIYSHLPSYFGIESAEMSFTLYPKAGAAAADVAGQGGLSLTVTATPNPFSAYTTINFSVPETADITMTLYDELGRVVQHVASSEFSAGPYSVRIERRGLANGVYVCEITSNKLNLHERIPIVAGE